MRSATLDQERQFRVWIAGYRDWRPRRWDDVPPHLVALELAIEGTYSAEEAAVYVAAYNQAMLAAPRGRWAVPVPVAVRYDGDLRIGQRVRGPAVGFPPLSALPE